MSKDYRRILRAAGRRSVAKLKLRTEKNPGDIEFMWIRGEYRAVRHEGEPESNVTPIRRRRAAA